MGAYRTVVVGTDGSTRLPGSEPAEATRRSACDVLAVRTTG